MKPAEPKTSLASCGPPLGEASARAALRAAEARPNARPTAEPKAPPTPQTKSLGFGLSPIPRSRYAVWATRLAPLRVAEAPHPFTAPFSEVRPRRAPHAPLKRRSRRERRFLKESRYSLLTYSSSPPAESSNELRRVAALRLPGRRTARLKEPQKPGPSHRPNPHLMLGPARRENRLRFSRPKNSTPKSTAQFSAPYQPHCGSACAPPHFRAPARFILFRLTAEIVESLLLAWRAATLREDTALGPRGPHVPWTGNAAHFNWQPRPNFSPRSLSARWRKSSSKRKTL